MKIATKLLETLQNINEKLIIINKGKKSGQIVFLAGGAASGKGFAASNFTDLSNYKVFNVDDMKARLIKIAKLKGKYSELANLDLKKPEDVAFLHKFVADRELDKKVIDLLLTSASNAKELPNILFDVTFKNIKKFTDLKPRLLEAGYKPEDIHIIWVLTNFAVAAENNATRPRVVPKDILLTTHIGAATTLSDLLIKKSPVKGLDGEIHVILNNKEESVPFKDASGKDIKLAIPRKTSAQKGLRPSKLGGSKITGEKAEDVFRIKSFASLKLKEAGKSIDKKKLSNKLLSWIAGAVPKEARSKISKK